MQLCRSRCDLMHVIQIQWNMYVFHFPETFCGFCCIGFLVHLNINLKGKTKEVQSVGEGSETESKPHFTCLFLVPNLGCSRHHRCPSFLNCSSC